MVLNNIGLDICAKYKVIIQPLNRKSKICARRSRRSVTTLDPVSIFQFNRNFKMPDFHACIFTIDLAVPGMKRYTFY